MSETASSASSPQRKRPARQRGRRSLRRRDADRQSGPLDGRLHAQGRADHGADPSPGRANSLPDSRCEGDPPARSRSSCRGRIRTSSGGCSSPRCPEIAEGIIEIRALAREAGYRTKVAVTSYDDKVDPVGACVGVRGSRIKNIVDELGGEKIDIVRWNDSSQILMANALKPAKVSEIALCFELGRATVVVEEDQLSLAIGKHGQNVRLAARLTGWDIDILTPDEYNQGIERLAELCQERRGGRRRPRR